MLLLCLLLVGASAWSLPHGVFSGQDNTGNTYSFSFLSSVACGSTAAASGVCQTTPLGQVVAGLFATQSIGSASQGVVTVNYSNGTVCAAVSECCLCVR